MDDQNMDLFEFAELSAQAEAGPVPRQCTDACVEDSPLPQMSRGALNQAATAFLVSLHPDALAQNVPTRTAKNRASVAGFWKNSRRNGTVVTRTALVMTYYDSNCCEIDCLSKSDRMGYISCLKEKKAELEAEIRAAEPHLESTDDLFSELRTWDYSASSNRNYHKLCKSIANELDTLCKGSRLERIRRAGVADQCYLAIPQGIISPEYIPSSWGIVELFPERPYFRLLREAEIQSNVLPEQRSSFAFNIAAAAAPAVRFTCGVDADSSLRRLPRRRGKLQTPGK